MSSCSSFYGTKSLAQLKHEEVIGELTHKKTERAPASAVTASLGASLKDLNRISPEKFEVYVFPKVSSRHLKNEDTEDYIGRPEAYEVSVLALSPCKEFIQNNLFGKYSPKEVFPQDLVEGGKHCAIMEYTSKSLRTIGKGELRKDDLLKVRLFLDSEYKIYATDYEYYQSPSKTSVTRLKSDGVEVYTGLNLYPTELPSTQSKAVKTNLRDLYEGKIDDVSVFQVRKKLNQSFSLPDCRATLFSQKNSLGESTSIGWCEKMPWPSYIENSRFISIIQPLYLR